MTCFAVEILLTTNQTNFILFQVCPWCNVTSVIPLWISNVQTTFLWQTSIYWIVLQIQQCVEKLCRIVCC